MVQVEKGGMDEAFVDITKEARLRVANATGGGGFHGHIHLGEVQRSSRSCFRLNANGLDCARWRLQRRQLRLCTSVLVKSV